MITRKPDMWLKQDLEAESPRRLAAGGAWGLPGLLPGTFKDRS
jgi:hypothetical protein